MPRLKPLRLFRLRLPLAPVLRRRCHGTRARAAGTRRPGPDVLGASWSVRPADRFTPTAAHKHSRIGCSARPSPRAPHSYWLTHSFLIGPQQLASEGEAPLATPLFLSSHWLLLFSRELLSLTWLVRLPVCQMAYNQLERAAHAYCLTVLPPVSPFPIGRVPPSIQLCQPPISRSGGAASARCRPGAAGGSAATLAGGTADA